MCYYISIEKKTAYEGEQIMNRPKTVEERRKAYFDREFNRATEKTRTIILQKQIEAVRKQNEELRVLLNE